MMNPEKWSRVKEVSQLAIELQPEERKTFIERECGDDDELNAIVCKMIEADYRSGYFLERPPTLLQSDKANEDIPDKRLGTQIGGYVIKSVLGQGGMGTVYRAEKKDDTFKRVVALKIVKHDFDTGTILKRFFIERRILANLDHPNIARLIDAGMTDDGLPYFMMEYVDGKPITDYCDETRVTIKERLQLFVKVCEAVQYAHQNLIVHRDLKPSNILVTENGTVKLLDFGIAKMLTADETNEQITLTSESFPVMTPEYASPEQILGEQITTATDVYALGIILYELLSGLRPYTFKTKTPVEIERTISRTVLQKPSAYLLSKKGDAEKIDSICDARSTTLDRLRRELSGDLDTIVMMALRKETDRRYQSAEQLMNDIHRSARNLPILARADTVRYRTSKFIKRHYYGVGTALIFILVLISGIFATSKQAHIASLERDRAQLQAEKAEQVLSFIQNMLSSPNPYEFGANVTVVEVIDKAVNQLESGFSDKPEVEISIRRTIGVTFMNIGMYEKAHKQFNKIISLHSKNNLPVHELAVAYKDLALINHTLGNYTIADSLYQKAIEIHRKQNLLNRDYAVALNDYSLLISDFGDYIRATEFQEEALTLFLNLTPDDHHNIGTAYSNLGLFYHYLEDIDQADSLYQLATDFFLILGDKAKWDLSSTINNRAFIYINKNDPERAYQTFLEAYEIRRHILGDGHIELSTIMVNIGSILLDMGKIEESIEILEEALIVRKEQLSPQHRVIGQAKYLLARAYYTNNDLDNAEIFAQSSFEIFSNSLGTNHWRTAMAQSLLGRIYAGKGNYKTAEEYLINSYNTFTAQSYQPQEKLYLLLTAIVQLYEVTGPQDKYHHYNVLLSEVDGKHP